MWRALPITGLCLLGFGLAWEFGVRTHASCGYDLQIEITAKDKQSLSQIDAYLVWGPEDAKLMLDHPEHAHRLEAIRSTSHRYTGKPLSIPIPVDTVTSPLGRVIGYTQFRHLVLITTLEDGRKIGRYVEIPDGRVARSVNIELP